MLDHFVRGKLFVLYAAQDISFNVQLSFFCFLFLELFSRFRWNLCIFMGLRIRSMCFMHEIKKMSLLFRGNSFREMAFFIR